MTTGDIKLKIKEMLVKRLRLKMEPEAIKDDVVLFDPEGELALDSIDALEVVVGLQKEFDCVITDKAEAEKILVSVNTIVEHLEGN